MGLVDLLVGYGVGLGRGLGLELGLGEGAALLELGPEGLRRRSAAATEEGREAAAFRVLGPLLRPSAEAGAASRARARRPPAVLRRACAGAPLER